MSVADPDLKDLERRMNGAIEVLKQEFAGLRTGRASVHLLEPINVDAYGSSMPMNQVGTIGVPEPRMITVQVWDRSLAGAVERAIRESDLGLNPQTDGQLIRVPIPMLSEERRVELSKIAHKYAEQARVAVRNVRRDGMDMLKRMEREHELSQDEQHMWSEEIQEMTDRHIKAIDEALEQKDGEIMQV
jgi:ribosome recycling factor